ncbi:hypothetical protein ACOSQ3_009897 [Xanthoceras sorbifolium]
MENKRKSLSSGMNGVTKRGKPTRFRQKCGHYSLSTVTYKCNYCSKDYGRSSKSCDTTSLWNHIELKCTKYKFAMAAEDKKTKSIL